jgi:zinc/manganese transport system substrate-binding protein
MGSRTLWIASALLALGATGAARADLRVVSTTPEYAAIVAAIGGDRVSVSSLARPAEDPHFVDAKPSHIVTLNRADVLVEGGADLEIGWLPPLVEGARNRKILPGAPGRVRASDGVALLDVPASLDRSQGDIHAAGNPHFMMDPANGVIVARHVRATLCALDAAGCESYRANLVAFETRLAAKDAEWTATMAPFRGRAIATYHKTWSYFANRFGLRADTFLEPKPGIPPSPPHLANVIAKMKEDGITVVLLEPFQSRKTAEVVASHASARVVDVAQFPGGLPETDGDYVALIDADVRAIAGALAAAGR